MALFTGSEFIVTPGEWEALKRERPHGLVVYARGQGLRRGNKPRANQRTTWRRMGEKQRRK